MLKAFCTFAFLLAVTGCAGSHGSQTSAAATPTPTPSGALTICATGGDGNCTNPALVSFGGTAQFTATALSGTTPALNWSVNGVEGGSSATGTISSNGLFSAPNPFDSGKSVTITATSQTNSGVSGNGSAVILNNNSKEAAPVLLGTSGGNVTDSTTNGKVVTCCSGTLGSLIQSGSNFYILSNNHVLAKSGQGLAGDAIGQPGLIDNNCAAGTTVANLTVASAIKPGSCTASPCTGPAPSNADAAIAKVVSGAVDISGRILDLGAVDGAGLDPAPPSATVSNPSDVLQNNEGVAKVGRSSGLTCSTLQSVSLNVSVEYASSCGGPTAFTATFSNQVAVNGGNFSAAGDSGSLIVTSDTARPVALLFAGSSSNTIGNPIDTLLQRPEFNVGGTPTMVGGGDHAVSCSAVASSGTATTNASSASLTPQERARVSAVKRRRASALMQDPAIKSVEAGESGDSPGEGALLIRLSGQPSSPIPPVIDGVRTLVISSIDRESERDLPLGRQDVENATAIKEAHVADLMSQSGIQGVGVGRSDDNPAEAAIVIYVVGGVSHPPIPPSIDGVRTKIIESDRFRAFGWGKEKNPGKCVKR